MIKNEGAKGWKRKASHDQISQNNNKDYKIEKKRAVIFGPNAPRKNRRGNWNLQGKRISE